MRGRLCVGRAAAAAAAVAVPLAGGQEGSPGGGRRGSRGTTMVKKRKGRVVIDSDTEDSGSDENLDQVRAGRGGAGRRSQRAVGAAGTGDGRAWSLPTRAPSSPRALGTTTAPFPFSRSVRGLGDRPGPGDGAPRTWRLGRGGGAGTGPLGLGLGGSERGRDLPGPDRGGGL